MIRPHQLEPKLKALRLGGMLDSLELRLAQAEQSDVGYLAFLELLLEDEIGRRENRALSQRVHRAHFDQTCTLREFDFTFNPKIPAAQIHDLAACRFIEHHESVILCGPVGVGKSHIAQALGHAACQRGHDVLYRKTNRFFADLAGGHADGTWQARLRHYLRPDLLILDDFGMRAFNEPQTEDLWELIGERRLSVIVVSNRAPKDWYALFPNPVLAESILDRLLNNAHHIVLTGRSYRPLRRPGASGNDRTASAGAAGAHEDDPEPTESGTAPSGEPAREPNAPQGTASPRAKVRKDRQPTRTYGP